VIFGAVALVAAAGGAVRAWLSTTRRMPAMAGHVPDAAHRPMAQSREHLGTNCRIRW